MKLSVLANEKFKAAVGRLLAQELPIKTAIVLKGTVDMLNKELAIYEESRISLLRQYGKKKDSGELEIDANNNVVFENDQLVAYSKEFVVLGSKDIEVPKITAQELGDKATINYDDLLTLQDLIN